MKFAIILLLVKISVISTKTVNYPNLCGEQTQKDPLPYRNEFNQDNPEPLALENKGQVNNDIDKPPKIFNGRRIIFNQDAIKSSDNERIPINKITNDNMKNHEYNPKPSIKEVVPHSSSNHSLPSEIKKNKSKKPQVFTNDDGTPVVTVNKTTKASVIEFNPNITPNTFTDENSSDVDITNIRELREHLLDHLLDYFINIIKEEEQYTETRKNGNDKMKVEDKLRNYYNPAHIDQVLYSKDSGWNEIDIDYLNGRRKGIGAPFDKKNVTKVENKNELNLKLADPNTSKDNKTKISNSPLYNILKTYPQSKNTTNITSKSLPRQTTQDNITNNDNINKEIVNKIMIPDIKTSRRNIVEEHLNKKPVKTVHEETETEIKVTRYNDESEIDRVGKLTVVTPVLNLTKNDDHNIQKIADKLNSTVPNHNEGIDDNGVEISKKTASHGDNDILDLTKAIVVHKNCAHKTGDDDKLGLLNQDLNKGNCEKNIILQFNINL